VNGVLPALGLLGAVALAGTAARRGSRTVRRVTLADLQRAIDAEDEGFLLFQNPHDSRFKVELGDVYTHVPRWSRVSEMQATWVLAATHALQDFLDAMTFPLVVYRGLLRDAGSTVRFQGEHWTTDSNVARAFADGTHENQVSYGYDVREQEARNAPVEALANSKEAIVLVGLLRHPGSVDWDQVHQHFLLFSIDYEGGWIAEKDPKKTEREVWLREGAPAPVEILEVRRFRAPVRRGHRWLSDQHLGKQ